jgi:hypothetical protein
VSDGYFDALQVPLVEGRFFDNRDVTEAPPVLVVSESWARRHFPVGSAVGGQVYEGGDRSQALTIVGVVGDVKYDGIDSPGEVVFAPMSQGWRDNPAYIHIRADASPAALVEPLRATLRRLDPGLVPTEVATLDGLIRDALGIHRHWAAVMTAFAAAAVVMSALGVFSVLAFHVARQRRVIGIRMAMGASRGRLTRTVIGRALIIAAAGGSAGCLLGMVSAGQIAPLLHEVSPNEPWIFGVCGIALLCLAAFAAWVPARRAAGIDPMTALREE